MSRWGELHAYGAVIHTADIQDRDGAPDVLVSIRDSFPWPRHVFSDGAYAGEKLEAALDGKGDWTLESSRDPTPPKASKCFRADGRRAHLRLVRTKPTPGQGLRSHHRKFRRMALAGLRLAHDAHTCKQLCASHY
ncbi:transposase [Mesorhizobium sp. M0933]|uniref:transposase n=1 Tax=Mesorhizobium sp. M0933 TaxID=2957030 RepID=UPI00333A3073